MRPLRATSTAALCTALVLSAQGCAPSQQPPSTSPSTSPPTPGSPRPIGAADTCTEVAERTVDALQEYVDGFTDVQPEGLEAAVSERQSTLADISTAMRERATELGCSGLREDLAEELDRLAGSTPVADSIAATLRSSLLGTADPSDPGAEDIEVSDVEQLRAAVSNAGSGSVITLAPGTYELDQTLVFFRAVTLRGAGGDVVLESSAEDAALLSLADGELRLEDLAVRHTGSRPGSVVVIRAGGHRLTRVEVSGARQDQDGTGGFGLTVQPALDSDDVARDVTQSTFHDNEAGGILVGGITAPRLRDLVVRGPGGCGVCFMERAGGSLHDSAVEGHEIGVRIDGDAAPDIRATRLRGNRVGLAASGTGDFTLAGVELVDNDVGLELGGAGAPEMTDLLLEGNTDTGVLLGGSTAPSFSTLEIRGATEVGFVISDDAAPSVDGAVVHTSGEAGIAATGASAGMLSEVDVAGQRIGLQVDGDAAPVVRNITLDEQQDLAILLTGSSAATLRQATCDDPDSGVLVIVDKAAPELGDGVDCPVQDLRE